jgi:protein-S-isoprenylcysteine O-methyltransferase Ste14
LLLALPAAPFERLGVPLFIAAAFLRVWARMHIGEHTRKDELSCPGLVQSGPYKYMNHPLYLSNFMAGASFALFHAGFSLGALGFCAAYGVFLAVLAVNENKFLTSRRDSSPRLPLRRAALINAIWGDRYTWLWQIIILTLVFSLKFFYI